MRETVELTKQVSASQIFGKLCVALREQNEIVLLSLVNTARRWEIENGQFVFYMYNEVEYETIQREKHIKVLEKLLAMPVRVVKVTEKEEQSIEDFLKEKIKGIVIK